MRGLELELGVSLLCCVYDDGLGLGPSDLDAIRDTCSELRPLALEVWHALLYDRAQFFAMRNGEGFELDYRGVLCAVRAMHVALDLKVEEEAALELTWRHVPRPYELATMREEGDFSEEE